MVVSSTNLEVIGSPKDTSLPEIPSVNQLKKETQKNHPFIHCVAGISAGIFSKSILQPLDLIKTRLQVQLIRSATESSLPYSAGHPYTGLVDAFRSIVRNEGIFALYNGIAPNLIGSGVSWGCYFFVYNFTKTNYAHYTGIQGDLGPLQHFQCAVFTGIVTCIVTNPIWMVKTRVQIQRKGGQYTGAIDCFRSIVKDEGPLALYRGLVPALTLVSNGSIQFVTYEYLRNLVKSKVGEENVGSIHFLAIGAIAKAFSSSLTYPLQVIKSRLYQRSNVENKPMYSGMSDVARQTFKAQGLRGFYSGLAPHLLKTMPSSALTFFAYENVVRLLTSE